MDAPQDDAAARRASLEGWVAEQQRRINPPPAQVALRTRLALLRDWARRIRVSYIRARWPPPLGTRPPIGLAVSAMFRDEARYLAEWVSFHRVQGVERFYLYDNRSSDDWHSALEPEIAAGIVEVQHWPFVPGQRGAYEDCLERHRDDARWIAFIDVDEFLFSPMGRPLPEILRRFDTHPGVVVNRRTYGTSGWEQPPEGLVTENYLWRDADEHQGNLWVKAIINPRSAEGWGSAHHFQLRGKPVGEDRRPTYAVRARNTTDLLRINHYYTRSLEEFRRKVARPDAASGEIRDHDPTVDAVRDEIILQFDSELRAVLSSRAVTRSQAPLAPSRAPAWSATKPR
jgi:Glycosyltransferase family 92